ncbi:DUF3833 domain-containing protein [Photobacterium nomapromontoriensis]|uniref:DUF3833 domain-containing protein n=1 Tax=Photobacterium nomapromontoriensis TaxID=2910237 RepID=UPI003D09A21E
MKSVTTCLRDVKLGFIFLFSLTLAGCTTAIDEYQGTQPDFALFQYFSGSVKAWGMLQDRSGKQTRRFEVRIKGRVVGEELILEEDFIFDDDEEQRRVWTITQNRHGRYIGKADDVIGDAIGDVAGNALNWRYVLRVPVDGTTYDISINDWMYRQNEKHLFNVAQMSKWGVDVGTITLFFEKQE